MVLDSAAGAELLLDVGLDRKIAGNAEVEISAGGDRWSRRRLLLSRHSPGPVELDRAVASAVKSNYDGVYFVVSRAGSTLIQAARRDPRVAYAAVDQGIVSFLGTTYRAGDGADGAVPPPARVSWTRLAVLRLFALRAQGPLTQTAIAGRIGVSHVAVGKQLPALQALIERTSAGWCAVDRAACWDQFLAGYPAARTRTAGTPDQDCRRSQRTARGTHRRASAQPRQLELSPTFPGRESRRARLTRSGGTPAMVDA